MLKLPAGSGERSELSPSVSRALQMLSLFNSERPSLGVSEIRCALSLSKTSTLGFFQALEIRGYSMIWETQSSGRGSVAAPVLRPNATIVTVLSLGFATSQVTREELPGLGKVIRKAAVSLARQCTQEDQKDAA